VIVHSPGNRDAANIRLTDSLGRGCPGRGASVGESVRTATARKPGRTQSVRSGITEESMNEKPFAAIPHPQSSRHSTP